MASEKLLEGRGRVRAERLGCLVIKIWPTRSGLPDRLVLAPGGRLAFVEWKTPKGRVSPVQQAMFDRLARLGFPVAVVRSQKEFQKMLDRLRLRP
jgi:hypothetical protein